MSGSGIWDLRKNQKLAEMRGCKGCFVLNKVTFLLQLFMSPIYRDIKTFCISMNFMSC